MEKKEIISKLLNEGCKLVKDLKVRSVNVEAKDSYVRIGIGLTTPVEGYVTKDSGVTYEKGDTNVIFNSTYSIASLFRDNENVSFIANHIIEHPKALEVILSQATITIIQQEVKQGDEYVNPWSTNETSQVFDHNTIINHIIDVKFSNLGKQGVDKVADKLLGI